MRRWLLPLGLIALLLSAWQVAASIGAIANALSLEDFLVPSPAEIASSLWENRGLLAENAWVTLKEILFGILCALVVGIGFAVAMHRWRVLRDATYPLIVASQTIPTVVIAPILVVWFGYGIGPKIFVVALFCFFPITVNVLDGLRSVDPEAVKMMRSLDASRWQRLRRVEAPAALPNLFTGVKIAVVFSPIAAVFAEWVGADAGLGRLIQSDLANYQVARQFAAVVVLSGMALILIGLTALAERRVVTWR
ncbi:MAG TPA: ABC transporter permease [Solirubrobacterales bacterium]|jgi:ABC-type nitrate/sulfonate/bicarbonate transport system permease component|nr:ABC transporter permease [Solirubrobacterales bacterium]